MVLSGYVIWLVHPIFLGPKLAIINPGKLEITTRDQGFLLVGGADNRANLTINDEAVYPNKEGYFSKNIELNIGFNRIKVIAKNRFNRETIKILKVVRE